MTSEPAKVYDPKSVEQAVWRRWRQCGAFDADPADGRTKYCIVIPPPNVTAPLHLGHALNNTLQDVLIRYKRMCQFNTLWMGGTDHAGIATQTVVEKRILAEEGKRRTDFPRDEFVARIEAWKDEYQARILSQLQLMGCSCDWRRTRFTMDEMCAKAVRANFYKLFVDGLIYRGKRLVNWDPATQTVLADDEVEHETVAGHFYYLQYPLVTPVEIDGRRVEHVTVATTRPETMLGDTAVAMNPKDPRAEALLGKNVRLPIVGRIIPIIPDDHVVPPDPDSDDEKARFSTGFLKVTPAHDPNDWEIGLRHGLAVINVLAPDASISDKHGWNDASTPEAQNLIGMDRFEARAAIVEWFRQENLLEDVREYPHEVGHSYRSHVPIEPYLSDQWYIAVKEPVEHLARQFGTGMIGDTDVPANSLAGVALQPVLDGRLRFVPERYAATYRAWLENLRDWPISRQLWWGHRIPIWTRDVQLPADVEPVTEGYDPDAQSVAALDRAVEGDFDEDFRKFSSVHYYITLDDHPERDGWIRTYICMDRDDPDCIAWLESCGWERDEDVLDTWFSSALWPFSTMGWPDDTPELGKYYPGDLLCTAREIITLWVSRMVMMGQYCLGEVPFRDVFIHAMIQDGKGRKMSKSLGNGIDPLDIIDSHGADAMRFTLVSMTTQTQDVRMPVEAMTLPDGREVNTSPKFDIGRNFCNKLWNASRFALMNIAGAAAWSDIDPSKHISDAWILSRLNTTVRDVTVRLDEYRFNEVADAIYHFMWDDFCDWYLEDAKVRINAGDSTARTVVAHCLDVLLRLLHPIAPFITEAIWAKLNEVAPLRSPTGQPAEEMLVTAQWPRADSAAINPAAEEEYSLYARSVRGARNVRKEHNVPRNQTLEVAPSDTGHAGQIVIEYKDLFAVQSTNVVVLPAIPIDTAPEDAVAYIVDDTTFSVNVDATDRDRDAEIDRLTRKQQTLAKGIAGIEGKLANEQFIARAPADVVERERERLAELQRDLAAVEESLKRLE